MQVWEDGDQSDHGSIELRVNKNYAQKYDARNRKAEFNKLREKEKRGEYDDADDDRSGSEDSETEDEDGEEVTTEMKETILKTLKLIKNKDPSIYDSSVAFFPENADAPLQTSQQKPDKPIYYKDLVRRQVLAEDVEVGSDEEPLFLLKRN